MLPAYYIKKPVEEFFDFLYHRFPFFGSVSVLRET